MTQLIVALDTEASLRHIIALRQAGVQFFKLNATTLMNPLLFEYVTILSKIGADLFLDLKIYDTRDTVERIARRAFDIGARFLTVHATPPMLDAAMRAKPAGDCAKVLAVGPLTDGGGTLITGWNFDGLVCSVQYAHAIKQYDRTDVRRKILVCPGIRPEGYGNDNHTLAATPQQARKAGADYIVVGRPIIDAKNPAAVARLIIAELSSTPASGAATDF